VNTSENFVNRLRAWRERKKFTQEEAARILGVGRTYLNQIENGRPPGDNLVARFEAAERESEREVTDECSLQYTAVNSEAGRVQENPVLSEAEMEKARIDQMHLAAKLRAEARELEVTAERCLAMSKRLNLEAEALERNAETKQAE